jgi:hypothetical protein
LKFMELDDIHLIIISLFSKWIWLVNAYHVTSDLYGFFEIKSHIPLTILNIFQFLILILHSLANSRF